MGLLTDTYSDILKKLQGIDIRPEDDFSGMDSDFNSSLGDGIKASLQNREGGSPLTQPGGAIFPTSIFPQNQGQIKTPIGNINLPKSVPVKRLIFCCTSSELISLSISIKILAISLF